MCDKDYTIIAENVCEEEGTTFNLDYIVEACNNYPKAIEWLKLLLNSHVDSGAIQVDEEDIDNLEQFLNDIEDGTTTEV